jgi:hypothetical protein
MEAAGKLCELPLLDCVQRWLLLVFVVDENGGLSQRHFPFFSFGRPRPHVRCPRLVRPLVVRFGITAQLLASGTAPV